jgi:hypothetical protein
VHSPQASVVQVVDSKGPSGFESSDSESKRDYPLTIADEVVP